MILLDRQENNKDISYVNDVEFAVDWQKEYNVTDYLGNVRVTFKEDMQGLNKEQAMDYSPYGGILWSLDNSEKQRDNWAGKEKDKENGLGDHGVRKYDHLIGRFNSIDPLWNNYLSLNPYQYSANSPVHLLDVDGEKIIAKATENQDDIIFMNNPNLVDYIKFDSEGVLNATLLEKGIRRHGGDIIAEHLLALAEDPEDMVITENPIGQINDKGQELLWWDGGNENNPDTASGLYTYPGYHKIQYDSRLSEWTGMRVLNHELFGHLWTNFNGDVFHHMYNSLGVDQNKVLQNNIDRHQKQVEENYESWEKFWKSIDQRGG